MQPTNTSTNSGEKSRHLSSSSSAYAKLLKKKMVEEELPRSAYLVIRIVEKNFPLPPLAPPQVQPTVLGFPVTRHRSEGPHWSPVNLEQESNKDDLNSQKDETNYDSLSSFAEPLKRKEKKKPDFSKLRKTEINEPLHEDLMGLKLKPEIVDMLKSRGKSKSERSYDDSKREKNEEIMKDGLGLPAGDWLESSGKIINNILWDSWSERVEKIRVCRFSLDGEVLGFDSLPENQDRDPSAIGYTISGAVVNLTRSEITGQKVLGLRLLSSVLNRALRNLQKDEGFSEKSVDWQAIWAFSLGPVPQIPFALKLAIDDEYDSVVLASTKAILSLLSHNMNEIYFDASQKFVIHNKSTCTAPVFRSRPDIKQGFMKGGFWKYNTKRGDLLPEFGECENLEGESEKRTVGDDVVVAGQDVGAGMVRMGLISRICCLLEMDPIPNLEETLLSILISLARYSPQLAHAILTCPNLIQTVSEILRNNNSTAGVRPAQIKALVLFKVLSKYNKQTCLDFMKNEIFQLATRTWYKDDFTFDKFLSSKNLKLNTNLIVEQLRFWRVCINYKLCISHFTDFFSFLCVFLSPPIFQKLIDQNALVEFCSVTRELYLVLQTLAEKLRVLHSKREQKERERESSWSWSHAVPMVDLAVKWLDSKDIPISPLDKIPSQETDTATLSSFLGVFSSIFHMLNTIIQKISPKETDSVPFLPDFVPRLGLALINNKFGSLFDLFINLRSNYENKNNRNHDLLLASTSCTQGLVQLSLSIDKLIQRAKPSSSTASTNETAPGGEILETGIINHYFKNLSEVFSVLNLNLSSNSRLVQSIETFKRGGPAPGLGFGWGAPGGGFWSVGFIFTQLDSSLVLDLIEIFTVLPSRVINFAPDEGICKRINSLLEVCLTVGPGDRNLLERAVEMLLDYSVLKHLAFRINYFIRQNAEIQLAELKFSEDELLLFRDVLMSHLKTRWLSVKKRSEIKDEKFNSLEMIREEETEDPLIAEWAQQRLPVPVNWILSPVFGTSETQISGLFLLLGFEAISAFSNSVSPISRIPLVWKLHALSFCLYTSMNVLKQENSMGLFNTLQELYSRQIEKTQNLDFEGEISEHYSTFLEDLIDGFSADSYADSLYGRQVAVYLNRKAGSKFMLNTWGFLASKSVLGILPPLEKCLGRPNGYLGPTEDNDDILKAYAHSWTSGGLERAAQEKSMAFNLASYHLSRFIFQSGTNERQFLRNKLATSLLRYHSKEAHNKGMFRGFIDNGLDASREQMFKDEFEGRFQILKDCCEGNSKLLVEVEKLKLSIS